MGAAGRPDLMECVDASDILDTLLAAERILWCLMHGGIKSVYLCLILIKGAGALFLEAPNKD